VRCVGDCGWNSQVTIDELLKGVSIALGNLPLSACEMFDHNGDGTVTVDELLRGVNDALNGCVDPLTPGDHRRTLVFGGYSRLYDVHIPPGYDGSTAVPLVIDFHGFSSSPTDQAGWSGWRSLADREDFIVAYPLGLFGQADAPEVATAHGPAFNAGSVCCGSAAGKIDDVGFARAIVEAVAAEAKIDRTRVYATGWSNGGAMSHRLACQAADMFAAVASVAGRITLKPLSQCRPSRPIAVVEFDGLHDPTVPYGGNLVWPSAETNFATWRDRSGCSGATPDERIEVGAASFCETYAHCSAGVRVEMCSVEASQVSFGAGHCLYLNPDIDIAQAAWEFLSQFRLPAQ
jgi:polyhydroxybutyrate depolymerase